MSDVKLFTSAFPAAYKIQVGEVGSVDISDPGMSLRDYFAGQALNTIGITMRIQHTHESCAARARLAYDQADAMLAERSKP